MEVTMEEILDVYDENKVKTEKKHIREDYILKANEYILVVEVLILNSKGEILLGQRSKNKNKNPLKWEATQGSVKSGENSVKAAARELQEELGIDVQEEELNYVMTSKDDYEHTFKDMFWVKKDIDINEVKFTDGEVVDAKWVDINEFNNMNNLNQLSSDMDFDLDKINNLS